jgi:hypothetical protein
MSGLKFTVGGREVSESDLLREAKKLPKRAPIKDSLKSVDARGEATVSLGFVAVGYSPEHWASRIADHKSAQELFLKDPNKNKAPGEIDSFSVAWMAKNKPKRARSKPYELESAAEMCADLMRKAGWLHVRVEELLMG